MALLLALIMAAFQAQPATADSLAGDWINQDPSTRGVTEILVRSEGEGLLAHAWGRCTPTDCDWGETKIGFTNGMAVATWDHGFAATKMELILLPDQRLLITYKKEYRDKSGRVGKDEAEFFLREKPENADAATVAAKALLSGVAQTYRNVGTARFEYDEVTERTGERSASRRTIHSVALISTPGKLRVETTGTREPTTLVSDGETMWEYFPDSNEFIKLPAGAHPLTRTVIGPFLDLDTIRGPAKIVAHERVGGTDCTVVEMGRQGGFTRILSIDPKTDLVWKEELDDVSTVESVPSTKTEITFKTASLGVTLAPGAFLFDPSKTGAKDRRERQQNAPLTLVGTTAPSLALRDLDGKEITLSSFRGRPVLLDFWATWCGPCRATMPAVELLHREFKNKGLAVLGVDDEDPQVIGEFFRKFGYTLPVLLDSNKQAANDFGVGAIPTTILIDRQGKIVLYKTDVSLEQLRDALREQGIW